MDLLRILYQVCITPKQPPRWQRLLSKIDTSAMLLLLA